MQIMCFELVIPVRFRIRYFNNTKMMSNSSSPIVCWTHDVFGNSLRDPSTEISFHICVLLKRKADILFLISV